MMLSFHQLLEGFLAYSKPKASYSVYCRLCDQVFFQWPQDHPPFAQIEDWYLSLKHSPHHANKGLSFLRAMYNRAIRRGEYQGVNPAAGIKRHKTFSRERVMTSQEVALLLECRDMLPQKFSAMVLVLLLTGCRLTEAREMQWSHLNWVTGAWYQPKTKNGKPHETYLPTQVRSALQQLKRSGDYVFSGAYEHCWSRAGVEKTWRQIRGQLNLSDVRLHDFRRTWSTHTYRATKNLPLVQRCINHHHQSVTMIYVRFMFEEVQDTLQAQADRFFALRPALVVLPTLPPDRIETRMDDPPFVNSHQERPAATPFDMERMPIVYMPRVIEQREEWPG
jgi:integrase